MRREGKITPLGAAGSLTSIFKEYGNGMTSLKSVIVNDSSTDSILVQTTPDENRKA
jgi:hypothetical protein